MKYRETGTQPQHDSNLSESVLSKISSMDLYRKLNDSQREAVHLGLSEDVPLSVIQGPPGTGKTSVMECIIHCIVKFYRKRILISAPSNAAVDNILERLGSYPSLRLCRVGNPERYSSSISEYSLERLVPLSLSGRKLGVPCVLYFSPVILMSGGRKNPGSFEANTKRQEGTPGLDSSRERLSGKK